MKTRLEICREMGHTELIDTVRRHPLASLMPCVTALLESVEVQPEPKPTPAEPKKPEPESETTDKDRA